MLTLKKRTVAIELFSDGFLGHDACIIGQLTAVLPCSPFSASPWTF